MENKIYLIVISGGYEEATYIFHKNSKLAWDEYQQIAKDLIPNKGYRVDLLEISSEKCEFLDGFETE